MINRNSKNSNDINNNPPSSTNSSLSSFSVASRENTFPSSLPTLPESAKLLCPISHVDSEPTSNVDKIKLIIIDLMISPLAIALFAIASICTLYSNEEKVEVVFSIIRSCCNFVFIIYVIIFIIYMLKRVQPQRSEREQLPDYGDKTKKKQFVLLSLIIIITLLSSMDYISQIIGEISIILKQNKCFSYSRLFFLITQILYIFASTAVLIYFELNKINSQYYILTKMTIYFLISLTASNIFYLIHFNIFREMDQHFHSCKNISTELYNKTIAVDKALNVFSQIYPVIYLICLFGYASQIHYKILTTVPTAKKVCQSKIDRRIFESLNNPTNQLMFLFGSTFVLFFSYSQLHLKENISLTDTIVVHSISIIVILCCILISIYVLYIILPNVPHIKQEYEYKYLQIFNMITLLGQLIDNLNYIIVASSNIHHKDILAQYNNGLTTTFYIMFVVIQVLFFIDSICQSILVSHLMKLDLRYKSIRSKYLIIFMFGLASADIGIGIFNYFQNIFTLINIDKHIIIAFYIFKTLSAPANVLFRLNLAAIILKCIWNLI